MAIGNESATEFNINSGLEENRPTDPLQGSVYLATDTEKMYVCYTAGIWKSTGGIDTITDLDPNLQNGRIYCLMPDEMPMFKTPTGEWLSLGNLAERRFTKVRANISSDPTTQTYVFTAPAGATVEMITVGQQVNGSDTGIEIQNEDLTWTRIATLTANPVTPIGYKIKNFSGTSTTYRIMFARNGGGAAATMGFDIWW